MIMVKTGILVSGGGANLQAVIDAKIFDELKNCELTAVISSDPNAYALVRAESARIPAYVIDRNIFPNHASFADAIDKMLTDLDIELVVLAGFDHPLNTNILEKYKNRMIEVRSALCPAFNGVPADRICEETLKYGAKVTGATAYFYTGTPGVGPVISQQALAIAPDETVASLQRRILEEIEQNLLPDAISLYCEGRLTVTDERVSIS